jgi:hypothetical protein
MHSFFVATVASSIKIASSSPQLSNPSPITTTTLFTFIFQKQQNNMMMSEQEKAEEIVEVVQDQEAGVVPCCEETASTETASQQEEAEQSKGQRCWTRFLAIYNEYEFLILMILVILLAKAYPPLGAEHFAPHISATWIAVIFIFGTSIFMRFFRSTGANNLC